jgi:hypothetical protein
MNTTFGETVLLTSIGSLVVIATVREVLMLARWINGTRRMRVNRR